MNIETLPLSWIPLYQIKSYKDSYFDLDGVWEYCKCIEGIKENIRGVSMKNGTNANIHTAQEKAKWNNQKKLFFFF